MSSQPLTHHEIIGLIEPFTRRGRHADLAASNRLERSLAFKPLLHAGLEPGLPAVTETLRLENPASNKVRLTRVLTAAGGPAATLVTEGPDLGALLAGMESVLPGQQLRWLNGILLATSHRLETGAGIEAGSASRLTLTHGVAVVAGVTLTLRMPAVRGFPADLELAVAAGDDIAFPEDLFEVLGWHWSRLNAGREVWRGSVRLRGKGALRSRDAEGKLETALAHLARTLGEAPALFHRQRTLARWGVFARRSIPLVACIFMIVGAAALPALNLTPDSIIRMLLFNSPPLLMLLIFSMREVPRIEIPPVPRAATQTAWRTTPLSGAAPAGEVNVHSQGAMRQ